jgi:large subunit ribosomal protein L4
MPQAKVYNISNKEVGSIDLPAHIFGAEVNQDLLYEMVKAQLASRRKGTAHSKGRSDVSGSTKKIYKQKGTGRARHGSIRAPIFVGGGKAHGPQTRSYAYKLRRGALCSALSLRCQEGELVVLDAFNVDAIKTKSVVEILKAFKADKGALIIDVKDNTNLAKSTRNLAKSSMKPAEGLNVYDILRHPKLIITKPALSAIEARLPAKSNEKAE